MKPYFSVQEKIKEYGAMIGSAQGKLIFDYIMPTKLHARRVSDKYMIQRMAALVLIDQVRLRHVIGFLG